MLIQNTQILTAIPHYVFVVSISQWMDTDPGNQSFKENCDNLKIWIIFLPWNCILQQQVNTDSFKE